MMRLENKHAPNSTAATVLHLATECLPQLSVSRALNNLEQWSSAWVTRNPEGTGRHLRGYTKPSYINQIETQESLEPLTSCDPRTHEDSSPNCGAGMPDTSSIISFTGQNHINN
jgi:hypothetical protein